MQGHKDFIVQIPERYKGTEKTESGFEYHLDKRFSAKDLANNIFKVINVPVIYQGEIKPGYNIAVDPILVHNQHFEKHGEEENQYLIDREKKLYKVDPSLIICYSKEAGTRFQGFENNLLCKKHEPKEKELKKIGSIIIPDMSEKKHKDSPLLEIVIGNDNLKELGLEEGDLIYYKPFAAIDFKLQGFNYVWLRNNYILGKHLNQSA